MTRSLRRARPPIFRDTTPSEVATTLRSLLRLSPDRAAPGEHAAFHDRPIPLFIRDLDAGGWIAWCMAGLLIFNRDRSLLDHTRRESIRVVAGLAMVRSHGNISAAARMLGTTRKVLRDNLIRLGLYPWAS